MFFILLSVTATLPNKATLLLLFQDTRSQTSSPHSGQPGTLDSPKTQHLPVGERGPSPSQAVETRGSSPLQAPELGRGPSPVQSFIDTIRSTVTRYKLLILSQLLFT